MPKARGTEGTAAKQRLQGDFRISRWHVACFHRIVPGLRLNQSIFARILQDSPTFDCERAMSAKLKHLRLNSI